MRCLLIPIIILLKTLEKGLLTRENISVLLIDSFISPKHSLILLYVMNIVNQFVHAPTIGHLEAVNCIICYLKRSPTVVLLYTIQIGLHVEAYTDANWVGFVSYRWLTSGYCIFFGSNLIKQSVVPCLVLWHMVYVSFCTGAFYFISFTFLLLLLQVFTAIARLIET